MTLVSGPGKGLLYHASWRGTLAAVDLLLNQGAGVGAVADGPFTYGKSALFFAVTRCRDDAVLLLLRRGCYCRLVNNKGQSLRSLAESHLKPTTCEVIHGEAASIILTEQHLLRSLFAFFFLSTCCFR